jgi:hypothetical protein
MIATTFRCVCPLTDIAAPSVVGGTLWALYDLSPFKSRPRDMLNGGFEPAVAASGEEAVTLLTGRAHTARS